MSPAEPRRDAAWVADAERGSQALLRFVVACFRRFGPAVLRPLVPPIAAYYSVFATSARRASRDYLARLDHGNGWGDRHRGWRHTYRHLHAFAESILDRFTFWAGAYGDFDVHIHGREHMERHFEAGTGAVLIGAHLGSWDVLRVISRDAGVRVNVLLFSTNAQKINAAFAALDPDCDVRVIDVDPSSVRSAFEVRRCVERGEFVAILGDRVRPGGRHRIAHASFLGARAAFPQGPFLLPILLRLPVILTLAVKTGPRSYDVHLETLRGDEAVPAADRAKVLQELIEAFAARLEHYCALAPYQWFNFYDFWAETDHDPS